MPFKSESRRRFMWMKHPKIAQKWVDEGAKSTGLPMHKKKKKSNKYTKALKG
jgi:hypothetical protein